MIGEFALFLNVKALEMAFCKLFDNNLKIVIFKMKFYFEVFVCYSRSDDSFRSSILVMKQGRNS